MQNGKFPLKAFSRHAERIEQSHEDIPVSRGLKEMFFVRSKLADYKVLRRVCYFVWEIHAGDSEFHDYSPGLGILGQVARSQASNEDP